MGQRWEGGTPTNLTSTGVVSKVPGTLLGFYVNNTTSGTIVLRDGTASGTVISGTITPAIGFHRYPFSFVNGLHATIANTLDVTLFVQQGG